MKDACWQPEPDAKLSSEGVAEWRKNVTEWLEGAQADENGGSAKKRKRGQPRLQRIAACRHLVAVDAALQASTGRGLSAFLPPAEGAPSEPLLQRRTLVLIEDQSSVNLAAAFYALFSLKLRLAHFRDEFHRSWNDTRDAVRSAGFGMVTKLTEICFNMPHGPWGGAKFFEECCELSVSYLAQLDESDPLLTALAEHMRRDQAQEGIQVSAAKIDLIAQLHSARFLEVKDPHVSSTRWYDWHKARACAAGGSGSSAPASPRCL